MRTIQLHPLSLLVGGAVALLAFVTMGQQSVSSGSIHAVPAPQCQEFVVGYGPHPRDYVQIEEGVTYTVPAGKSFVLGALGSTGGGGNVKFMVDGIQELSATSDLIFAASNGNWGVSQGPSSMKQAPRGLAVQSHSVVDVMGGTAAPDDARAWGYLVQA